MDNLLAQSLVVSELDRAEVVAALYNHAVVRNPGVFEEYPSLGTKEAGVILEQLGNRIEQIHGLDLNINFDGRFLHISGYDRIYGVGAAARALSDMSDGVVAVASLQELQAPPFQAQDLGVLRPVCATIISNILAMQKELVKCGPFESDCMRNVANRLKTHWLCDGKELSPQAFGFLIMETIYDMQRGFDSYREIDRSGYVFAKHKPMLEDKRPDFNEIIRKVCPADFSEAVIKYLEGAQSSVGKMF